MAKRSEQRLVIRRLRRWDPAAGGWSRRRAGRGFRYLDEAGHPLPESQARRCRDLAIPPAWTDVVICPWPNGHLQAVGRDAAGRMQYLYHPVWRRRRDAEKFRRMLRFGTCLPEARLVVAEHLQLPGMPRERALAAAFRLVDRGAIRIGGEVYARERGSVGIATMRRDHVEVRGDEVLLQFPGKSGRQHEIVLSDRPLATAVRELLERDDDGKELLAFVDERGWHDVRSSDVNEYIRRVTGWDASAKDFRTWHANVRLLDVLATQEPATSAKGRAGQVRQAVRRVAEHLGNTPTVARASYIDPRLCEQWERGRLAGELLGDGESSLLSLLAG